MLKLTHWIGGRRRVILRRRRVEGPSKSAAVRSLNVKGFRRSMPLWKSYHLARSIPDALESLSASGDSACLVAGGTDLLLDLQQGRHPLVETLVDITAVPELNCLELRGEELFIGAAVPLNRVVGSLLVQQHAEALLEAARLIGGPQVRNTATLGGNVAHALPAADGTIALLSLDARAEVASQEGTRRVALSDLFLGPGRSALHPRREVLVGFYLPLKSPSQGSAFQRVMRPQGVAIAILNMSAWVQRRGGVIEDIRLAVGPAGPRPVRAYTAEDILRGRPLDEAALDQALQALYSEAHFRTSPHRASAEYRHHLTAVLLHSVVSTAWSRTFETLKH
jgi:CO/xanthine dehydrogenase FAD-binding subunit